MEFGRGFSEKNLRLMIQFAEAFPDDEIVATLSRELSWSHFRELLPFDESIKRDFYAEMCRMERWSVRTLRKQIDRLLFERTAVSKKPDELIVRELEALRKDGELTPDLVFRDLSCLAATRSLRRGALRRALSTPRSSPQSLRVAAKQIAGKCGERGKA